MRFWLTLVLGTIIISFCMTWLVMHQGKEVLPVATRNPAATETDPPSIEFDLGTGQRREANVVEITAPPSTLGNVYEAKVKFTNSGKGSLRIEFFKESCGCLEIQIDGKALKAGEAAVVKKPGESGELLMKWRPEQRHLDSQADAKEYRFSVDLKTNDPRFLAPVRLEALTKIVP